MRRKSDAHSARASSYSTDDESFAAYFEDKLYSSALYEFSQGLGPEQVWEYNNSNENLMRFVVNTPPPDTVSTSTVNNGERVTNIISKFEDLYYLALYSQVLDCQARGFTRSIVLVVANQSSEIIKYVHEAYVDELTKIIDHIYENSYKLFLDEIQEYSLSLLKTAEATNSAQLRSKYKELKTYLPNFGINIDKIINEEEEKLKQQQNTGDISSENKTTDNQDETQPKNRGKVKDELFFTKIDNNLRSIRTITNFDYSIIEDLQELITNLPKTETSAAISAHIDLGTFHNLKSYPNIRKNSDLKTLSDDTLKRTSFNIIDKPNDPTSFSSNILYDGIKPTTIPDDETSSESLTDINKSKFPPENHDKPNNKNTKLSIQIKSDSKSKTSRKQPIKDTSKKRYESIFNRKPRKNQKHDNQHRQYAINYPFDLNFGGFKGQYSRLVTDILNTNYDGSLFTLQWLARFKVFHYCAFTILSGGTLVIVTENQDTEHGKLLADRFSLLAPHPLIKGRLKTSEKWSNKKNGDMTIYNLNNSDDDSDDNVDDSEDDTFDEDSQVVLVKETVEPRECFRFSIVVTNCIKQPTPSIDFSSEKVHNRPIVTTFSRTNEKDESLLSVLDLTTNIYKGDGCPDSSFVMKELGNEIPMKDDRISSFSSVSQVGSIQQSQTQTNIELGSQNSGRIASSSSNFSPVSKKKLKPSFNLTMNSPPSPLSIQSDKDEQSPLSKPKLVSLRNYSSSIITMSGSNSNTNLNSNQKNENDESELSISEIESEFHSRMSSVIGTYGGFNRHAKRPFRPSFLSDVSTISTSNSMAALESSESENLFVLNMYAIVNRVAARFVRKLAEFSCNENQPSKEEIMKEIGFDSDDEPILKYWIYCFFNKQKCRPVLFNNRSNVGFTVISMYK